MIKGKLITVLSLAAVVASSGCKKEQENVIPDAPAPVETTKRINLNITGLQNLGVDYRYEGWLIVGGQPVSAGVFAVDDNGKMSHTEFDMKASDVVSATAYVLTIEPFPDENPLPSKVHILAGDFNGDNASLTVTHKAALGTDFSNATGQYIIGSPSDGDTVNNELSGLWWVDLTTGPGPGLSLPTLPEGWTYEGWVVIDGVPVSTGTFTSVTGKDNSDMFSAVAIPSGFPGEDFLTNAPSGLKFPVEITGAKAVISVEPQPDNSPAPFVLKPLAGDIPKDAMRYTAYMVDNNAAATNPTGTASR